jgi:hypothetical protein
MQYSLRISIKKRYIFEIFYFIFNFKLFEIFKFVFNVVAIVSQNNNPGIYKWSRRSNHHPTHVDNILFCILLDYNYLMLIHRSIVEPTKLQLRSIFKEAKEASFDFRRSREAGDFW